MSKMHNAYKESFNLENTQDEEYAEIISDLLKLDEVLSLANYEQHIDIDRLQHVKSVSYLSYKICKKCNLDYVAAARAGLLHDLFYYDWREKDDGSHRLHGYRHPSFAVKNAKKITSLSRKEENIIKRHMWPLTLMPPRYLESYVVNLSDKYSATAEMLYSCNKKIKGRIKKVN